MSKNINACFTSNTDDWKTPKDLYDRIISAGYIDTFPYQSTYDEFSKSYFEKKLFCNPPFSKLEEVSLWLEKQLKNDCEIILLIPSRTDTKYFHHLLNFKPDIYFIRGRLHYNDMKSAPFPSMILHLKKFSCLQEYEFGDLEFILLRLGICQEENR